MAQRSCTGTKLLYRYNGTDFYRAAKQAPGVARAATVRQGTQSQGSHLGAPPRNRSAAAPCRTSEEDRLEPVQDFRQGAGLVSGRFDEGPWAPPVKYGHGLAAI